MVKKQKEETPNVNATANRDVIQRLNFLYQASVYLQSTAPSAQPKGKGCQIDETLDGDNPMAPDAQLHEPSNHKAALIKPFKTKQRRKVNTKDTGDLARSYVQSMRVVGQKTTVKMDPSLKRSLCPGCSTILIPGSTASVRVKKSRCHGHTMVYTCLHCRTTKRIPAPTSNESSTGLQESDGHAIPSGTDVRSDASPAVSHIRPWKRKTQTPRPLPLFARLDAGHVVFRGNERVDLVPERGSGSCFG
ncbi:RNAse P Rpr2/Rpp21/SNM1 subunit domain-containing protein [Gymnopilus junonius]|uniref:RNAse P Rpr2/Rpp21/SNM1 subunit domain-containing protein n=1 Tax=Gymnopilus junonius TaxID=109634 RepID=A0A9P5NI62_GYMJU|nr:RNAse P Rpr2/Rpp21/SNM1 subunit domain-containing protein [Gymnopilus junonius]